jgi:hypothetical protein
MKDRVRLSTVADLMSSRTPARHKFFIKSLNPEELDLLLEDLINLFETTMATFIDDGKDIGIPAIGSIRIKTGSRLAFTIKDEVLAEFGVEDFNELSDSQKIEYKLAVKETIAVSKSELFNRLDQKRENKYRNMEDNFVIKFKNT